MHLFGEVSLDEQGHLDFLETQIELLHAIGAQNYCQLNAESAGEVDD